MQQAPWYKQIWAWLIMLPPAAAVVAGLATVVIAHTGADDVISDDYVKTGLELREDASRREAAQRLGLSANVHLVRADGRVIVVLRGLSAEAPAMHVRLVHPTDASRDLEAPLQPSGGAFRADVGREANGRWLVQVEPADRSWRLAGELAADASAVELGTGT